MKLSKNRTGFFYLGIIEANSTAQNNSIPDDMMFDSQLNFTHGEAVRDFSTNYSVRIYTSGCYFYNYDLRIWSGSGWLLSLLIWARRQDIKDREKCAATDSKVQFILSGDDDETVVRTLEDPKRKLFRRNAADTFVMATPR
ncbi:polycystic kidney disease protein 1-like 2 [Caerostris extrusa]|uniref:Polycystic kidney disease protein 1-like 2 n=1 Tax=Caerostris extrusa TaxID=172846 RepID=A0AAV4PB96_CAEEX|nr:polycystic kidney disease protein 1-like 2 [Caerostris extrusa]